MRNFDISVVIPAYNEEKYIKNCIDAIKAQKTKLTYEIIVIDNNSKDKTKEIAKKQNVKVVTENKIQGVGAARRTGTKYARGDIIVHIDADTLLYPDHLEKVKKHFETDKNLVCLGGIFIFYDAPIWKNIARKILYKPFLFFAKITSKGVFGPPGGNMAFRKNIYEKTEGFDKNLKFGEDIDICSKLKKHGRIRTDLKLKVQISSRRFYLNKNLLIYTINFFHFCIRKKPYKNTLPH